MLTLGQAAKLVGVSKSTLARAVKSGQLSASRRTGRSYSIDHAELERVYTVRQPESLASHAETLARLAAAEAEVRELRERLEGATRILERAVSIGNEATSRRLSARRSPA